ncbi:unnamed protein product [Dicrocoelium dendriticum]|nr:unnamed protein product [Dicrocoelium dendriticum]
MATNMAAHLSLRTGSLSTPVSSSHLMHFTNDISLSSIKSSLDGSPLVDDEDDDMRSLLAAAAAVAASVSPGSPHLRSSSSGLNTPPDTRLCRPLDSVMDDGDVKSTLEDCERGLHTVGGAALLVSRLSSTASAYANAADSLSVHLPSTSTSTSNSTFSNVQPTSYSSTGVAHDSPSSLFFSIQPPLSNSSEHSLNPSDLSTYSDSVRFHNSVSLPDNFIPNVTFGPKLSHPSTPSQAHRALLDFTLQCPGYKQPPDIRISDQYCSSLSDGVYSSSDTFSSDDPNTYTESHILQSRFTSNLPESVHSTLLTTHPLSSQRSDNQVVVAPPTWSRVDLGDSSPADQICTSTTSAITCKPECPQYSLPNSKNLLPASFVRKASSQHCSTIKSDCTVFQAELPPNCPVSNNCTENSHTTEVIGRTEFGCSESVFTTASSGEVTVADDLCTYSLHKLNAIHSPRVNPAPSDRPIAGTPDSDDNSSPCPSDGMLPVVSKSSSSLADEPLACTPPISSDCNFPSENHSSPFLDGQTSVATSSADLKSTSLTPGLFKPAEGDTLLPPDDNTVKMDLQTTSNTPQICDESEYVSAAVAAVEDVVYALAGNRRPDPSLAVDPALEGTGTDRIFNLNLAPVHVDTSFISTSTCHSSLGTSSVGSVNGTYSLRTNDTFTIPDIPIVSVALRTSIALGPTTIDPTISSGHLSQPQSCNSSTGGTHEPLTQADASNNASAVDWERSDSREEFRCSSCNRVFAQKSLLLKHRIMHDEPRHTCDACGRCFVREDKLKRHIMSIHTTEKPHACCICGKAFSRKDKLKDHLKHHERAARNFECQQCQQRFVQKSDLNRHIRGVHQGEPGVGINMGTKRRATSGAPIRLNKKKSRPTPFTVGSTGSAFSTVVTSQSDPESQTLFKTNCRLMGSETVKPEPVSPNADPCTKSDVPAQDTSLSTVAHMTGTPLCGLSAIAHSHPLFTAGATPGLMLPAMTLTQAAAAQQHFAQQQQAAAAAAAAAAVMLPGGATVASMGPNINRASTLGLPQQPQQQFFAINAIPHANLSQPIVAGHTQQQQQQATQLQTVTSNAVQGNVQLQSELKTVATPSGPMMVLTRIAAANQAGQAHQLASHAVFPQMVGFHPASTQQQLHQLQQQAAMAHHHQLLQQHQASYAAVAAAANTRLVAVSGQQPGHALAASANLQIGSSHSVVAHQFHLHQQATQQLQQQQAAAALAARHHAAQSLLFSSAASSATPAGFFCHPQDGVTAGLLLASSTDPASFALAAAAQAQAAAAVAAQQQTGASSVMQTAPGGTLSASAFAAATGLQVVSSYPDVTQAAVAQQQQLLLQQHHQQRLAAVAAATHAVSTSTLTTPTVSNLFVGSNSVGGNVLNGSVLVTSSPDDSLLQSSVPQVVMAQPDSTATMSNCYQLAAALYQQHHPSLVFAAAHGNGAHPTAATTGSAVAAMALHHQQQQYQQQQHAQHQVGLMAAYQQQQHHSLLQQQQSSS